MTGGRFALFGEVLLTGVMVFVLSLPVLTLPAALVAGIRHLRRFTNGEGSSVAGLWRDFRDALWGGVGVALVALFGAAAALNPLCLALSPLAVAPLVIYPYGKRFTNWPHAILGLAQMVAPVGAWLAVTGTFAGSWPAWVLGVAVGLWIGGFDLIYASQDAEVDRRIGVHSVPARYGVRFALRLSTAAHVVTFALFIWYGELVGFGWPWWTGLAATAVAFGYQHIVVTPGDLSRVNRAFFTANGFVGIALFAFALVDLVVRLGLRR